MKINKRYSNIVSGLMISVSISLSISFFITLIKSTPMPIVEFIVTWLKSSLLGFCIGFPLAQLYVPKILKIVDDMTEDEESENV